VVSLQNHFHNSNDDQNSDLVKFNISKCVHVSRLNFFGSRVFYMFLGIHRLQICRNWIYKTKVIKKMVFITHFCHFIFTSKFCTVLLRFLCIFVFYTFLGFQGYQVCNIWPSRYFLSILQVQNIFYHLKFKFKSILTQLTGG
jgi:hypothetical protein